MYQIPHLPFLTMPKVPNILVFPYFFIFCVYVGIHASGLPCPHMCSHVPVYFDTSITVVCFPVNTASFTKQWIWVHDPFRSRVGHLRQGCLQVDCGHAWSNPTQTAPVICSAMGTPYFGNTLLSLWFMFSTQAVLAAFVNACLPRTLLFIPQAHCRSTHSTFDSFITSQHCMAHFPVKQDIWEVCIEMCIEPSFQQFLIVFINVTQTLTVVPLPHTLGQVDFVTMPWFASFATYRWDWRQSQPAIMTNHPAPLGRGLDSD